MPTIKTFIKFFMLICSATYVYSDCTISAEAADKCGVKAMIFGNREASVPTNDGELDAFCAQARVNFKCFSDFNDKCLTGTVQMAIKMALNNGKKFMDKRCDIPKDRQDFLKHVKCLSPKEKMEPFHLCADRHLVRLTTLKEAPKKDRVPALCCILHMSQDCLRQQFKQVCGEETSNYWDDSWEELAQESMQFSCSEYDSTAKCEKSLNPDVMKMLRAVDNLDNASVLAAKHKFKSEAMSAVEFIKFFTEE